MRAAPMVSIARLVLLLHVTNASSSLPLSSKIAARAAADPAAIENANSDAVTVAAASDFTTADATSAPAADAVLLEQSTYSLRMQQNRRVAMNSESSAYLNADNTRAADNELLTTYIKDQTQTPFGTIFTENLHVIYGVSGGVMLLAIVILAVMLVRKNRAREQDYPEEEPLLRESIDQVDAFLNSGEQEEMNKTLLRQRKMADDLKKQAGMIMSRGNNQLDDQLCDADMSSNYPARKEEQERHTLLEAATTILESTASLEKERERTRSAAVAARAFEQHLLVARLATENERKQKDLLVAHAEHMKQHHKTEVERQREAALAAERRHKKVIDDANKQREILKAKEEEHKVMLQQQHETELERQKAAAALAIKVAAQKERERLKAEDDQRLVQVKKDHEQRIQSANEERATLLKAALDKERALAKQREIQIEKQAEAAKHELVQVKTKVQAEAKSLKSQLDAVQAEASLRRQKSMTEMSKLREEAVQAKAHAAAEKERRDQAELAIQLEKQKSATAEEKAAVLEHKHAKALDAAAQAQKIAAEERQKSQEAIALAKKAIADHHEDEASRRIKEELALEKKKIEDERALEKETSRKAMEREVNNDAEAEASRLKKRRPSFRGSLLTKSKVVDTIGAIFEKKACAHSFNLAKSKPRVSLMSSTRDFFVQMYGSIARDRRVAQFRHSVLKHKATSLRIQWFATLVGWNEDQAFGLYTPFRAEAIHAFIDLLLAIFPMDVIEENLNQDPCMVNLDSLFLALGHQTANAHDWTFGGMSNMKGGIFQETYRQTESFQAMLELLITSCVEVGSSSAKISLSPAKKKKFLEFDFVMDVVLREWYKWKVPSSEMGEEKASGPSTSSAKSSASLMVL